MGPPSGSPTGPTTGPTTTGFSTTGREVPPAGLRAWSENPTVRPPTIDCLADSLRSLKKDFDAHCDVPRMIALLSSSPASCEMALELVQREMLDAHPHEPLHVFLVWQDLVPGDDAGSAALAARRFRDPRVSSYHDATGRAGRAFARGHLPVARASEVYLFYPAGVTWAGGAKWNGAAPATESWWHQLGRIAPERFCTRAELPGALGKTMDSLVEDSRRGRGKL